MLRPLILIVLLAGCAEHVDRPYTPNQKETGGSSKVLKFSEPVTEFDHDDHYIGPAIDIPESNDSRENQKYIPDNKDDYRTHDFKHPKDIRTKEGKRSQDIRPSEDEESEGHD